jgi:hypothetical protein
MLIVAVGAFQAQAYHLGIIGPLLGLVRQPSNDPLDLFALCRILDRSGDGFKISQKARSFVGHDMDGPFFLGRQSLLSEGLLFEVGEVCRRIAAEAGAQDRGVVALFQAGSGFAPFGKIDGREVLSADRGKAGQRGGEDGAAHDQAWRDWGGGAPISLRPVVRRSW